MLDLTKGELIDALGRSLFDRFGHLDGLVACAAELGAITPVSHLEPKTFERIMAVNLVANQRLIRSLDPLLRASPAGRAVFVTDGAAGPGRAYWGGYAATKAALEAMVLAYAAELRLTQVRVNLFDPGPMATRLRAQAYPGERPGAVPEPAAAAQRLVELLLPTCRPQRRDRPRRLSRRRGSRRAGRGSGSALRPGRTIPASPPPDSAGSCPAARRPACWRTG